MPLNHYGIFLAYAPDVDFTREGLGRYLAEFLKNASLLPDTRFVVACPHWLREPLQVMCEKNDIDMTTFDLVTTRGLPVTLRLYKFLGRTRQSKRRQNRWLLWLRHAATSFGPLKNMVESSLASTRSLTLFTAAGGLGLILMVAVSPLFIARGGYRLCRKGLGRVKFLRSLADLICLGAGKLRAVISHPTALPWFSRLYHRMETQEIILLAGVANSLAHVRAWYCPSAFWPSFAKVKAPKLMCLPDLVLEQFPFRFAESYGPHLSVTYDNVVKAVRGADHFVVYSNEIKYGTLVRSFGISSDAVHVVPHGANCLGPFIQARHGMHGFIGSIRSSCEQILLNVFASRKSSPYMSGFRNPGIRFMFYASQFRPNKNVMTLLEAYRYLLRHRFVNVKLVLTGNPDTLPDLGRYIGEHHLHKDVLCVQGLSIRELAAFYHLAEIAVNPSLFEGGFPFTFTEAMSVGTPVVMSDIPVTRDEIADERLAEAMLFNPYDFKAMAEKLEWALANKGILLDMEKPLFDTMVSRTWKDVVSDHVAILQNISV
ncbi:MAG: glycosyltransferase [Pseudomonadota bacterium]